MRINVLAEKEGARLGTEIKNGNDAVSDHPSLECRPSPSSPANSTRKQKELLVSPIRLVTLETKSYRLLRCRSSRSDSDG
ncbi:hypothetical protein LWI29_013072 [Acer saccharum]|uniref:Uncharacterized protein n=1 Tax=Acer saccharum TaxID=4024 RepID=A0AA39SJJ4_ACESA|nr:hypothetical protein LWI29_013072 [Acer saccharum]